MKFLDLRKCLLTAILSSFALIAFMIESLIPPIILPGARLGLSNVFILLALIVLGDGWAFAVLIIKTVLGSLFAGNISSLMYSLPAGVVALAVEITLLHFPKRFGIVAVSTIGAVINIVVQNIVFCFVTNTMSYLVYTPYLALIGTLGGLLVGFTVYLIVKYLPTKIVSKFTTGMVVEKPDNSTNDDNQKKEVDCQLDGKINKSEEK